MFKHLLSPLLTIAVVCAALQIGSPELQAQPGAVGTNNLSGSPFTCTPLTDLGVFRQARIQANQTSSATTWEFPADCTYSGDIWRPYNVGDCTTPLSLNTVIPPLGGTCSALYNSGNGGASGNLAATTNGNYYTFNIQDQLPPNNLFMSVLETTYSPTAITTVTQTPATPAANQSVLVTVTTASAPASGENVFVRFSTDAFITSTIVPVSFTGTIGTAVIPCFAESTTVAYYVYSSNRSQNDITTDVGIFGQIAHDMSTLNLNNNSLANYNYTVVAVSTNFAGVYSVPSSCYPTLASFVTALNAGTVTGPVTVNVAAGHSETVPTGGIILTATGTLANQITIQKFGTGPNPVLNAYTGGTATPASANPDGIFAIVGGDYITVNGLTFTDGNTTNPATMEFGIGLFKASTSDGAQNNTIQNCIFNMQRVNNASGSGPMVEGSVGILMVNSTRTAAITALTPTVAAGSNSFNKFYGNTTNGGNYGIAVNGFAATAGVGPAPTAATFLGDLNNDIGGTASSSGNTILNFGGGATTSPSAGIRVNNQWGVNISYNTINNNNGSGVNHATTLRGIFAQAGTSASATINNNNLTIQSGATTSQVAIIENSIGSTAAANTITIANNTLTGAYTTATSGVFFGIYSNSTPATVTINNNTVQNLSYSASTLTGTGTVYPIYHVGTAAINVNISNYLGR